MENMGGNAVSLYIPFIQLTLKFNSLHNQSIFINTRKLTLVYYD